MNRPPRDDVLAALVEEWKGRTPPPPADLAARILRVVRAEHEAGTGPRPRIAAVGDPGPPERRGDAVDGRHPSTWARPLWAAAGAVAALLLVAAGLLLRAATPATAPMEADRLLVVEALREAEAAERQHARAIARLQEAAGPILARATDPELPGEQAARLMMLADRLRFLDQTIAEIRGYLENNPGHPGARATLLAAYTEKTTVLRDVVALNEEISS